jgi:U1 small nuclear ribonucleoprotein
VEFYSLLIASSLYFFELFYKMTASLPPTLLALFAPRPPLPFAPPLEKPTLPHLTGISSYLHYFTEPEKDTFVGSRSFETKKTRKDRIQKEKWQKNQTFIAENLKNCTYC